MPFCGLIPLTTGAKPRPNVGAGFQSAHAPTGAGPTVSCWQAELSFPDGCALPGLHSPRSCGRADLKPAPALTHRNNSRFNQRGQAVVELALQIPILMLLMFGVVQVARIFYVYHMLESSLRGGAGLLARSSNINYCDNGDLTIADAKNFIAYGNILGTGPYVIQGLTPALIHVVPERQIAGSQTLTPCTCGGDATNASDGCDTTAGGRAPDFIVVNLSPLYQLLVPFPYISFGSINLNVSVRMPVTGS